MAIMPLLVGFHPTETKDRQMTKQEFLAMAKAMYRVGNMGDSDNPARPDWVNPSTVSAVCANLDDMFLALEAGGVLSGEERSAIYDTL